LRRGHREVTKGIALAVQLPEVTIHCQQGMTGVLE
jgi:hypothetical protein